MVKYSDRSSFFTVHRHQGFHNSDSITVRAGQNYCWMNNLIRKLIEQSIGKNAYNHCISPTLIIITDNDIQTHHSILPNDTFPCIWHTGCIYTSLFSSELLTIATTSSAPLAHLRASIQKISAASSIFTTMFSDPFQCRTMQHENQNNSSSHGWSWTVVATLENLREKGSEDKVRECQILVPFKFYHWF